MNRKLLATGALSVAALLAAAFLPASQAAATLPAPTGVDGAIVDNRAQLDWDDVAGARDYVVFDVSTGQPGRVVGTVRASDWTSVNLPGRESFTWQVVARDPAKVQGARSQSITLYPGGAPDEPTPPPPTEPPAEPTDPTPPPPTEPTDPPAEPTDPTTPPPVFQPQPPREGLVQLGAAVSWQRLQDPVYRDTFLRYFDAATAENDMKARALWPERGRYNFTTADAFVDFMVSNGKEPRGHTLFWHGANPNWLTSGSFTQAEWRGFIQQYATDVVSRYADRVNDWDVLNEIIAEDGVGPNGDGLRTDNPWINGHGGDPLDAIEAMFRAAHAANPAAKLYINDFSVEFNRPKTEAYYRLVKALVDRGVPIHGVGFQSHLITESEGPGHSDPGGWSPTVGELTNILQRFADLGVQVQLTEADLKTSPTPGSTEQKLAAHADMARVLAQACQNVDRCPKVTWWGVNDSQSWLGAGEMTLLFSDTVTDGTFTPKPAYKATREVIGGGLAQPEPPVEEPTDPQPPAAQPIRTWGVDAGDSIFDVWPEIHAPLHERVQVSTEQVFPGEDASIRFETRRSDVQGNPGANSTWNPGNTGTRRAEVRDSIARSGNIGEGTDQWWSWATYFPADFDWDERGQFFGFMQFHQTANSGNPPVHFWVDEQENMMLDVRGGTGGRTSGDAQYTERFNLGPVALGAWNDLQVHFVWSSDPDTGLVEVYRNGQRVLSETAANLYSGQSAYVKQGIYSANGREKPTHVIYTSTTRLGDSLESVRPPIAGD